MCRPACGSQDGLGGTWGALAAFVAFLRSPGVLALLGEEKDKPEALNPILKSKDEGKCIAALLGLSSKERKVLAKFIQAVLGKKAQKVVSLGAFKPEATVIWEEKDLDAVIADFGRYLKGQRQDGKYLKLER